MIERSDKALKIPKLVEALTRKCLGEKICKLLISEHIMNINMFPIILLSDKVMLCFDVLGTLVIFCSRI